MDADGDTIVTAAELGDWRASLGYEAKTDNQTLFEDDTQDMLGLADNHKNGGNDDGVLSLPELLSYFGALSKDRDKTYTEKDLWTWTFLPLRFASHAFDVDGTDPTSHTFGEFGFYRGETRDRLKKDLVLDSRDPRDRRWQRAASMIIMILIAFVAITRFLVFFCPCCLCESRLCKFLSDRQIE